MMYGVENNRQTSDDEGLERRSRPISERNDSLGYIDEKILQLKKSRAGYISVLTKVYNEISGLISGDKCNVGDIASQLEKFNTAWYEFVSVQEKYLELLEAEADKQKACASYEEQRKRKLKLDAMVTEWRDLTKLESKNETGSKSARSRSKKCPRSETSSSNATSTSKKREKMALARLKVEQLKIRQEFEMQEQEIKRKKEMAEAEMEAEMAAVSFEIHERGEGSILGNYELEQCISSSLRKEVIGPSECSFTKALNNKQSHIIEMKENIRAPTEGRTETKGYRNTTEPQKRTDVIPSNEERQSHIPTHCKELPFVWNDPVSKFQETGTVPLEFTTTTAQVFPPNPAVWAPVTTWTENRWVPASLPQSMNIPSTMVGSHQPHGMKFNVPNQQVPTQSAVGGSSSHQQQGHAASTENSPAVDDIMKNTVKGRSHAEELTRALRQVVNMPKIEYLHFNGDPLKYGAFIHNFENCLERDDPDDSRKLQLLIQHCTGKAKEAIESCVNLPSNDGCRLAKETLHEHFGKPHVIAMAHLKKLMNLPQLKLGDGPSLLEFSRHLSTAERTLSGMGASYVSDLNHMNTLRELAKKLPMHLRRRWTEQAGNIIEEGRKPEYADFLKFVRQRARLVNNEFGTDMLVSIAKAKGNKGERGGKNKDETSKKDELSSFVAGADENDKKQVGKRVCEACSGQHRIWRCERFKVLELNERQKVVRQKGLCNKCLERGHIAKKCPKTNFKCRVPECGAQHHTLLHCPRGVNTEQREEKQEEKTPSSKQDNGAGGHRQSKYGQHDGSVAATRTGEKRVCLGVVPVRVRGNGKTEKVETYALLDSGSEVTLCHERLTNALNLDGETLSFTLTGINGSTEMESKLVDIVVESLDGSTAVELSNVKTVKSMPVSKDCIPRQMDLEGWHHLQGVEVPEIKEGEVFLLIGLKEKPRLFLPLEVREGGENAPIAIRYSLGWTVLGPVSGAKEMRDSLVNFARTKNEVMVECERTCGLSIKEHPPERVEEVKGMEDSDHNTGRVGCMYSDDTARAADDLLSHQLERLWNTDFMDPETNMECSLSVEDKRAIEIMENSLKMKDGHFQVALPWRKEPLDIPNNKPVAERRLDYLKRRLQRDSELFEKYKRAMQEYFDKGHAEKVPKDELGINNGKKWYLPHHPVKHQLKPEKVRVVFDCAAKYQGQSLNMQLLQGPDLTNSLVGVLIRFREEPIALVADIESMFMQVFVDPADRDVFRFLWWENNDLNEEPTEFRMIKHVFGATSSPSCVNFCLKKTSASFGGEFDKEVAETVDKNMYVDDLMKSVASVDRAIILAKQLRELLQKGGFKLTKWLSNNRAVLAAIPENERARSVVNLNIEDLPTELALGLKWNVEDDIFVWEIEDETLDQMQRKAFTKRGILSVVSSLFDPLGMIAPFIMKGKLLLQELCRKKLQWDEEIEESERKQWLRWLSDLSKLKEVKIQRCFKPQDFGEIKRTELHVFSDGSRVGYGAAAYLRVVNENDQVHCSFVMGRARVAPIKEITIPRLELSAAVVSVQLRETIERELVMNLDSVTFWVDSMSVLKCIKNETKRFHTFESNRLTTIHNGSKVSEWRYIRSEDNPGDDASKGLKLDVLLQKSRWLKGPEFLWKGEGEWPVNMDVPPLNDEDPEVRKGVPIYVTGATEKGLQSLILRYSSWWRLVRAFAWLLRFKDFLKLKVVSKNGQSPSEEKGELRKKNLTAYELRNAERNVVRCVQLMSFPEIYQALHKGERKNAKGHLKQALKNVGSSLYQLNPIMKEGLLVVGGRLTFANISEDAKHQMIMPSRHHATNLLIRNHHEVVGHMGQESVLASLREKFWILKGRATVRRVIRSCVDCQKRKKPICEQLMADLPRERVTGYDPPFTSVGVDYFGPIEVKQRRSRVKRYGCLFTCLNTRALHIEIAHSLNTDSMINALRRFVSARGCPRVIRSDCGTNFTKADKELKVNIEEWNQTNIENFCTQRGIEWIFNPPGASHMGGSWERMIRSVRQILRALLKEQIVCDEVLSTIVAEFNSRPLTRSYNSRPLTRSSSDLRDPDPLTPNHLLQLRPCPSLPPGVFGNDDKHTQRQWRQAQYLANVFWKRWTKEYIPCLQRRQKWNELQKNLKVGDVVLLTDGNFARGQWPLARVVDVFKGEDGLVRSADVKTCSSVVTRAKRKRKGEIRTTTTILKRPITKLCRLELDEV